MFPVSCRVSRVGGCISPDGSVVASCNGGSLFIFQRSHGKGKNKIYEEDGECKEEDNEENEDEDEVEDEHDDEGGEELDDGSDNDDDDEESTHSASESGGEMIQTAIVEAEDSPR